MKHCDYCGRELVPEPLPDPQAARIVALERFIRDLKNMHACDKVRSSEACPICYAWERYEAGT